MAVLKKASTFIIGSLEQLFLWWGRFVSVHPYPVILSCIIITAISSLGFLKFRMEHRANMLWIPPTSDYNINQDWLDIHFKNNERNQLILYKSENVLTPSSLKKMLNVYKEIRDINIDGDSFEDICARIPIADIFQSKRRRRRQVEEVETNVTTSDEYKEEDYDFWGGEYDEYSDDIYSEEAYKPTRINFGKYGQHSDEEKFTDTSDNVPDSIYCDLVTTLNEKCVLSSLLEMWRYDEQLIETASQQEILDAVNRLVRSPWYGYDTDFTKLLGGVTRNSSGHVVAAKTAQMYWRTKVPEDAEIVDSQGSGLELELADKTSLDWEEQFLQISFSQSTKEHQFIPQAAKSFGDVSSKAIFFDAYLMAGGYLLMFAYTIFMLGKINCIEVRLYLSISGIVSIGMGLVIAMGLSSALGFPYTPMHAALPFLCLGIGIDDMFVIVQCWNNLKRDPTTIGLSIPEKMGLTLRHAGVSVTVTSLTDVFAFGVGAVSRMPGLQSFCICTAIGLGAIYLLQVSWFAAWMSLDEHRVELGRNGLIPCVGHKDNQSSTCLNEKSSHSFLKTYETLLASLVFKLMAFVVTVGMLVIGVLGWVQIRQKFDPVLLLPADSYLRQWIRETKTFYPGNGWDANLYSGEILHSDLAMIEALDVGLNHLKVETKELREVDSWWPQLKKYTKEKTNFSSWQDFANPRDFPVVLSDFLFSSYGAKYKHNFLFKESLICNQPAPPIIATKFSIAYFFIEGPEEHIPARRAVSSVIEKSSSPFTFSHSKVYAAWETDEIIGYELYRNIGLSMACVFVVTLILLTNLKICLLVIMIVVITLTDIVGFLHFWDVTIDIISCVNIVLAIGLCVDYSVHIGHAFIVAKGNRQEKAVEAISTIGPAVLNGGITTFLALLLCSMSSSHVFIVFFKVFSLTVVFGLFHGLVLFPVILSLIGPVDSSEEESRPDSRLTDSSETGSDSSTIPSKDIPDIHMLENNRGGINNHAFVKEGKPNILEKTWIHPDKDDVLHKV